MHNLPCDEKESFQQHFMDDFGGREHDSVKKLKRRPKCETKNKWVDSYVVQVCDDKAASLALQKSAVVQSSLMDRCVKLSDIDQENLLSIQDNESTNVQRSESLPVFDILCSSLRCSEHVTPHQAAVMSNWLTRGKATHTASSSLMHILMTSKCPLVSHVCCRMLKQLQLMPSISSCMFLLTADCPPTIDSVISSVLFLQKEMVQSLETGQFSMNLINIICLLDCIAAKCQDNSARSHNNLHVYSRFCTHWSSSELRWAALTVMSLANVISTKVKSVLAIRSPTDEVLGDHVRSVRMQVERIPEIVNILLTTSVHCEVAQESNIFRICNEYWHTTDFDQRRLIVDSILVPKLRMELCVMILAGYCDVLLQQHFAFSLSLSDFFSIFRCHVIVSAISKRVWIEDSSSSVVDHCREISLVLCNAVCSYVLHHKGQLFLH